MNIKDGIAIDNASGLVWQRCIVGTHWNSRKKQCDGEVKGLTQQEALVEAGRAGAGWHVPSARELKSIRLDTCRGPKIDTRTFPNIGASDLGEGMDVWSSTPAISADTFYFLNFSDGSFDFHSGGFNLAVLLVKRK